MEVGFGAEHEGARLPIVAELRAAKKTVAADGERVRSERGGEGARPVGPAPAGIAADVEAGPGEDLHDRHGKRRGSGGGGGSSGSGGIASAAAAACHPARDENCAKPSARKKRGIIAPTLFLHALVMIPVRLSGG